MIKILALDFDGVICNGLPEYFETSKKTYNQIWTEEKLENQELQKSFYKLRPVIESGWEMPILLRALVLNFTEKEILENWSTIRKKIVQRENLEPKKVANQVDQIREIWIKKDLQNWLSLHNFYDGVIAKLKKIINSDLNLYIITTKEGKFVQQLLINEGLKIPVTNIFGKEKKRPKYEILRQIIKEHQIEPSEIYFVEDRLPALELVYHQSDLRKVGLFLASWGYNTEKTRNSLKNSEQIKLLSLENFTTNFP